MNTVISNDGSALLTRIKIGSTTHFCEAKIQDAHFNRNSCYLEFIASTTTVFEVLVLGEKKPKFKHQQAALDWKKSKINKIYLQRLLSERKNDKTNTCVDHRGCIEYSEN